VDPGRARIHETGSRQSPSAHAALVEKSARQRELPRVVHATYVLGMIARKHVHPLFGADGSAHEIRQIVLALRVLVQEPRKRELQEGGLKGIDGSADFLHGLLAKRGVLFLDDPDDRAGLTPPEDAPISRRVREL